MDTKTKTEVIRILTQQGRQDLAKAITKMTTAADQVDPKLLKEVEHLTDINNHEAARILVAEKVLKNRKLAGAYQATLTLLEYLGHMDPRVGEFQYEVLDKQLKTQLDYKGLTAYWDAM
jgi:hypothetical protein